MHENLQIFGYWLILKIKSCRSRMNNDNNINNDIKKIFPYATLKKTHLHSPQAVVWPNTKKSILFTFSMDGMYQRTKMKGN